MSGFGTFVKKVLRAIGHVAVESGRAFASIFTKELAERYGAVALEMLSSALGKLAVAKVQQLMGAQGLDGTQKANQALADVLAEAKKIGLVAETTAVKTVIEMAYQFLTGRLNIVSKPGDPPRTLVGN